MINLQSYLTIKQKLNISDLYTSNIVKFNSSWVEISTPLATYGNGSGKVKFPKGMLVSVVENKIYIADTMSGEIEEFTLS